MLGHEWGNALIHQDFFVTGAGPMVELFEDRMEISNPGMPLVATERFLDTPPLPTERFDTLAVQQGVQVHIAAQKFQMAGAKPFNWPKMHIDNDSLTGKQ